MKRLLTKVEQAEIIQHEWTKARAKNPKVVMRVNVQAETDESGKPRVNVVIAFGNVDVKAIGIEPSTAILLRADEVIEGGGGASSSRRSAARRRGRSLRGRPRSVRHQEKTRIAERRAQAPL